MLVFIIKLASVPNHISNKVDVGLSCSF